MAQFGVKFGVKTERCDSENESIADHFVLPVSLKEFVFSPQDSKPCLHLNASPFAEIRDRQPKWVDGDEFVGNLGPEYEHEIRCVKVALDFAVVAGRIINHVKVHSGQPNQNRCPGVTVLARA